MRILVTGGLGFMGSDYIRYTLDTYPDRKIINLDKQTYAANPANLADYGKDPRHHFVLGDIAEKTDVARAMAAGPIDAIVNFAAETHVDRSIQEAEAFLQTAALGTYRLLEAAKEHGVERFIQISTDEVFGEIETGSFTEHSPLEPRSPYSAAKAAGDLLVGAYYNTYQLPIIVTHCCNNFGPYQYPEKLIPLAITNLLEGKTVPIYGDGKQVREWLYVRDHSKAIDFILQKGEPGAVYNIGSGVEMNNIHTVKIIIEELGLSHDMIEFVKDRPGHDRRYAINASKLHNLGWSAEYNSEEKFRLAIKETIQWYKEHESWWKPLKSGEYLEYYKRQYLER